MLTTAVSRAVQMKVVSFAKSLFRRTRPVSERLGDPARGDRALATLRHFTEERLYPERLQQLASQACPLCTTTNLLVSSYPFSTSPQFSRLLLLHCTACGLSWTPNIPFDLGTFYAEQYAEEVQPFRKHEKGFYDSANPFWKTRRARAYSRRAERHLSLIEKHHSTVDSVMDYGPGVGITLSKMNGARRLACELDEHSRKILSELGVELIDAFSTEVQVDVVVCSHALEHLPVKDVPRLLGWFFEILKPDGVLLVEVPRGFNMMARALKRSGHGQRRQEPHTVFFSSLSLSRYLVDAGFELEALGVCPWTQRRLAKRGEQLIPELRRIRIASQQPLALVRKPAR